ncbi:MAG: hypothetical protein ABR578_14330 [Chromatocurvus sp.]
MAPDLIGIVIQGPLVSTGRTGRTAKVGFGNVTPDDIVSFDCFSLIASLFERYGKRYQMVCVVWDTDPEERRQALKKLLPPGAVLEISDDTRPIAAKGEVIPGNNKYRQIRSSLAGFEILRARGCAHLGKIRSDQDIDLDVLMGDYCAMMGSGKVLVPRFVSRSPDVLADFYFMGQAELMINLFQKYLEKPEMFSSIHTDIFYSWAEELIGPAQWPLRLRGSPLFDGYVRSVWTRLCPASRTLYAGLIWRGEPIDMEANTDLFAEDFERQSESALLVQRSVLRWLAHRLVRRTRRAIGYLGLG